MTLRDVLTAAGHVVRACGWCGRWFPADEDYTGRRHAPQRRYCTPTDRDEAAAYRRNPRRRARRRHLAEHGGLIARHDLEAAGQLPLTDDPLPPVPPLEET